MRWERVAYRLAELQRAALKSTATRPPTRRAPLADGRPHIEAVERLTARYGFELVGCGSTRFAVKVPRGVVGKVAYHPRGLVYNINEAALWLMFTDDLRAAVAAPRAISSALVLLQDQLEPISPTLVEIARDPGRYTDLVAAWREHAEDVAAVQEALGHGRPHLGRVRMDNHGRDADGRIVLCDYGERFVPYEPSWAWALDRLTRAEPRMLALHDTERERFVSAVVRRGEFPCEPRPTIRALVRRTGLRTAAGRDGCPCATQTEEHSGDGGDCELDADALDWLEAHSCESQASA